LSKQGLRFWSWYGSRAALLVIGVEVAYVAHDRLCYVGGEQVEHAVHVGEAVDGL
jgi:hypothetical protein